MTRQKRNTGRAVTAPAVSIPEPGDWTCVGILLLLVAVFFREILLGNAWFFDDFLYQNYPFRHFAAVSLAMGEFPLWNPYTFNGMPFQADIQTAVLYFPMTLLTLAAGGGSLHHYWLELVVILHFALAAVSMFFLARSFDLRRLPSLLAAVAYGLSAYMVLHAIHQQLLTLVAWYPLVWFLFRKTLQSPRWWWVALTAVAIGHTTFAGFPQLSLYLYAFLGVFLVYETMARFPGRRLVSKPALHMVGRGAAALGISLPVAAVQLLPTLELSDMSQRASISYEMSVEGSLDWSQLLTLVNPGIFGTPGAAGLRYWGPGPYWHFWETCIYVGIGVLFLTVLSSLLLRRHPIVPFLWGVIAVGLLFALGKNFFFHRLVVDLIPGFSRFRIPSRVAVLITLASALLAAFSLQHLLYETKQRIPVRRIRRMVAGLAGAASIVWVLTVTGSLDGLMPAARDEQMLAAVTKSANTAMLMAVLAGSALFALTFDRWRTAPAAYGVILLVFLDLLVFAGKHNNGSVNPAQYFGRAKGLADAIRSEQQNELFRVNTRTQAGMIMDRNQGMVDRIFVMEGFTPLVLRHYLPPTRTVEQTLDLMNAKYRTVTDSVRRTLSIVPHPTYFPRAFFLYETKVVAEEAGQEEFMRGGEFDHRRTAVIDRPLHVQIASPDPAPRWSARVTRYGINRMELEVDTERDGLLVLSEIWYPGWRATVDGHETPVYRTDYSLRGVVVPAGVHSIEMSFFPDSLARGLTATGAALGVCGVIAALSLFRTRRSPSSHPPPDTMP